MRRFIGSFVVVLATLFLGSAVQAERFPNPNPAPPAVAPLPGGTDASAQNCLDTAKLDNAKVRDQFVALTGTLFESEPCAVGKPRVIVTETKHSDSYYMVMMTVDDQQKDVISASDDGMVAGMLVQVAMLRKNMDGCERAKRLARDAPTDGVRLVIARCSGAEADAFAEKFWKMLADMGKKEAAAILAEHLGLADEAARLRGKLVPPDAPGAFGFLRINSQPWATEILVDGRDIGATTPVIKYRVSAGLHSVTLRNPKFRCEGTFDVAVAPDQTASLVKRLDCAQQSR